MEWGPHRRPCGDCQAWARQWDSELGAQPPAEGSGAAWLGGGSLALQEAVLLSRLVQWAAPRAAAPEVSYVHTPGLCLLGHPQFCHSAHPAHQLCLIHGLFPGSSLRPSKSGPSSFFSTPFQRPIAGTQYSIFCQNIAFLSLKTSRRVRSNVRMYFDWKSTIRHPKTIKFCLSRF